ncbi:ACT domain protein [Desulfamplus magnetovallimortis]|uniref:ACT domain protein n=1 Tax=Desulfamplus magnetovallimortis TaxID=1246637 RepID=A0A1W1HIT4_9BACT|nr:ACT domain-containing protein [Desulfamplus magnetovallimortis]SLM32272.1 ACT domain protein [Desulfamplus magnetovallimortis]
MEKKFIMTAFGKDRPGIVADVSGIIYENGCNLEDSQMGLLADEFTLMLLLSGRGEELEDMLQKECRRLEKEKNISVFIKELDFHHPEYKENGNRHTISVEGIDQGGIVYKISKFLSDQSININRLTSQMKLSPESGTALYTMTMDVSFPETVFVESVEKGLERIGDQLNVDITVK